MLMARLSPTKAIVMSFEAALRSVEILVAVALIQRGAEHLQRDTFLSVPQIALAMALIAGLWREPVVALLWLFGLVQLVRFDGPYNGGADKMVLLILTCLCVANLAPPVGELALGYLGLQLVLSYFVSGWVKLKSGAWRSGEALSDVFAHSAYPVSDSLRGWSERLAVMRLASRGVIVFEVLFPLTLSHPVALAVGLSMALVFHLANAILFGLNRFVWAWLASYPALIWLQARLVA